MEEKRAQKRVILPYVILAIVMISTALILAELWTNVSAQAVRKAPALPATPASMVVSETHLEVQRA